MRFPGIRKGKYYFQVTEKKSTLVETTTTKPWYIVGLDEGFPVATCRWFGTGEGTVEIGRVVVLPEYRGKRRGMLVMEEAEKWIWEQGYKKIELSSRVEVTGLYEKLGYRYNTAYQAHSGTFDCVYMEKLL